MQDVAQLDLLVRRAAGRLEDLFLLPLDVLAADAPVAVLANDLVHGVARFLGDHGFGHVQLRGFQQDLHDVALPASILEFVALFPEVFAHARLQFVRRSQTE